MMFGVAASNGALDDVPVPKVGEWEKNFLQFMRDRKQELWNQLTEKKELTDDLMKAVDAAIGEFKKGFKPA